MLSDEVIEKVTQRLVNRIEQGNEYILQKRGESVKKIGTLSPTDIQNLQNIIQYGGDYEKIVQKLEKILNINAKEINEIFEEVAKSDYQFAEQFYKYRYMKYVPYEENVVLQSQVNALSNLTAGTYMNLTNTRMIGFNVRNTEGNMVFKDLRQTYVDLMDTALLNISQGKQGFDEAMYGIMKDIGESGVRVVSPRTYINKDGEEVHYTQRLDSTIREELKSGIRNLHNEMQEQIGEEIDADGIEISVHSNPAPDHADVQGRQFSTKAEDGKMSEWEKLQTTGEAVDYKGHPVSMIHVSKKGHTSFRPISMYNCYHYVFSIILGVNEPQYNNEQLEQINEENQKGFTFDGNRYTNYEGTQLQRKLELEIRKQKDTQILAKASDNKELIYKSQEKIIQLTNKYKQLSNASGLPTYMERMRTSGYRRVAGNTRSFYESNLLNKQFDGITIKKVSEHLLDRKSSRDVWLKDIMDGLSNPLEKTPIKYDDVGRSSLQYVGKSATIVINPKNGAIVSVWKTGARKVKRLMGDK